MKMKLMTAELARAISFDEGNRNMKINGRNHWNIDDAEIARKRFNALWPLDDDILEWIKKEKEAK